MTPQQLINVIVTVAVFGLIFSVWCICIVLWFGQYLQRMRSVRAKLGITGEKTTESETLRLWRESAKEVGSGISPDRLTWAERLEAFRRAAGWHAPVLTVVLGVVGLAILGFVVAYLVNGVIIGVGVFAGVLIIFWSYTKKRIEKYSALFERQLVDALGIAARALRAGHPLMGSFQLIAEEIDEPVGDVFQRICQEQMLGLDLKDSIRKVARGAFNSELKFFATSVAIQLQSGGNLADLMDSVATIIRARLRLNRRVRVMTAQTQFSKRTLIALPIVMFFWLNLVNPEYMKPLYTTTLGKCMLCGMVCSLLLGSWVMNRMTVLRF